MMQNTRPDDKQQKCVFNYSTITCMGRDTEWVGEVEIERERDRWGRAVCVS